LIENLDEMSPIHSRHDYYDDGNREVERVCEEYMLYAVKFIMSHVGSFVDKNCRIVCPVA
jgi:hypothetical protein